MPNPIYLPSFPLEIASLGPGVSGGQDAHAPGWPSMALYEVESFLRD